MSSIEHGNFCHTEYVNVGNYGEIHSHPVQQPEPKFTEKSCTLLTAKGIGETLRLHEKFQRGLKYEPRCFPKKYVC